MSDVWSGSYFLPMTGHGKGWRSCPGCPHKPHATRCTGLRWDGYEHTVCGCER